jgi:hypothetical protein
MESQKILRYCGIPYVKTSTKNFKLNIIISMFLGLVAAILFLLKRFTPLNLVKSIILGVLLIYFFFRGIEFLQTGIYISSSRSGLRIRKGNEAKIWFALWSGIPFILYLYFLFTVIF